MWRDDQSCIRQAPPNDRIFMQANCRLSFGAQASVAVAGDGALCRLRFVCRCKIQLVERFHFPGLPESAPKVLALICRFWLLFKHHGIIRYTDASNANDAAIIPTLCITKGFTETLTLDSPQLCICQVRASPLPPDTAIH